MKKEFTKTLFALLLLPSVISVSACASKKDEPVVPPEPDTPVTPDEPVDPEPQPEPEDDKPKASLTTNYFVERTTKWFPYECNIENFLEIGDEPNRRLKVIRK